jgi:hypothetical protein
MGQTPFRYAHLNGRGPLFTDGPAAIPAVEHDAS